LIRADAIKTLGLSKQIGTDQAFINHPETKKYCSHQAATMKGLSLLFFKLKK